MVLTTTNHPPYSIDVDGMGFPRAKVKSKLPADIASDEKHLPSLVISGMRIKRWVIL